MATGDPITSWLAINNEPLDADYAEFSSILTASSDEPDDVVGVLDFDPGATQEYSSFSDFMSGYGGGGLTLTIAWISAATSGNVKWDAAFKSFSDDLDDLNTKAYAAVNTATEATAGVAGELKYTDITFTDGAEIDNIADEEYFRVLITRDSADAGDTMNSNDARVIAVYLKET